MNLYNIQEIEKSNTNNHGISFKKNNCNAIVLLLPIIQPSFHLYKLDTCKHACTLFISIAHNESPKFHAVNDEQEGQNEHQGYRTEKK